MGYHRIGMTCSNACCAWKEEVCIAWAGGGRPHLDSSHVVFHLCFRVCRVVRVCLHWGVNGVLEPSAQQKGCHSHRAHSLHPSKAAMGNNAKRSALT